MKTLSENILKISKYSLLIICMLGSISCSHVIIPNTIIGNWSGKQKVKVRYKLGTFSYKFVAAPDSIEINIKINENGTVSGTFGNAVFTNCRIQKNRGWLSRKLHLATDFVIRGNLTGIIFKTDTIKQKMISIPMEIENMKISGSAFQIQGMGLFPMSDFNLTKQPTIQ